MDAFPASPVHCTKYLRNGGDWFDSTKTETRAIPGNVNHGFNADQDSKSPTTNQTQVSFGKQPKRLQLVWSSVSYSVTVKSGTWSSQLPFEKKVLKSMSGVLVAGSMTALMGPSGAGKSSLLNCVTGKIACEGRVCVRFPDSGARQQHIRIGFVPQTEHFFTQFSVAESLLFASRLNNANFTRKQHKERVRQTLRNLDLEGKRDEKLYRLSGGQLKRTSIGLELVSDPAILILDEPTSGLDSDNSEKLVRLLKNLTTSLGSNAPAIMTSIHQPSVDAFLMFDEIYLLSRFGDNIYSGPPHKVMEYVLSFGFKTKSNTNPAEYMTEIANGKYGMDRLQMMAAAVDQTFDRQEKWDGIEMPIASMEQKRMSSLFNQFCLIFWRNLAAYCIKSPVAVAQMVINMASFLFIINMRSKPIGWEDGCWSKIQNLSVPLIEGEGGKTFFNTISENIWDVNFNSMMSRSADVSMFVYLMVIYFLYIPASAAVTYFPLEVQTVRREMSNNWYSVAAYFFAKILSSPIILVITNLPAIAYCYFGGEFPADQYFRFGMLVFITMLLAMIWDARGFFFSVLFKGDALKAVLAVYSILIIFVLLSGFYIKYDGLRDIVKPISHVSDMKYGFSSITAALYGYNRCNNSRYYADNNLLAKRSMTRAVNKMWSTFNMTKEDGRRLSLLIGTNDLEYFDPVFRAIDSYVGPYEPNESDGDMQQSFVLHFNTVQEADMTKNIAFLITSLFVTYIGIYWALCRATRSHKLRKR